MTDIFQKFDRVAAFHESIVDETGIDPLGIRIDKVLSPTQAIVAGKPCIMLGSNSYLGLTFDPDAIEASCMAARTLGTGTTGSRVANGSYAGHEAVERDLADFLGKKNVILFTTGYQANVGFLSAIGGKDDYILIDSESHASIYDGVRVGHGTTIHFRHNNPDDLERRLKRLPAEANKLVVTEGIFSMRGDCAPIREIVAIAKRYNAYIMLDEAHSLGVLGENGRGLAEREGVEDDIDFIIGTFSKSLGAIGGFCVSDHAELDKLRYAARAYMFTASLPPAVVAAARKTIARIRTDKTLLPNLWRNTDILYDGLKALGYQIGPDKTPMIGVMIPDIKAGLRTWRALYEEGVYVNLAVPPATPGETCVLRCSVGAAHSVEELNASLEAFEAVRDIAMVESVSAVD